MFKHLLSSALLLCICAASSAQSNAPFQLVSVSQTQAVIKVLPGAPSFYAVQTPNGVQYKVDLKNGTDILEKGMPDLDKLTTAMACPDGMKWTVSSVETGSYVDYTKAVAPSKGNVVRTVDINALPFEYAPVYSQNDFYPTEYAALRDPYVLRDYSGQSLLVFPTHFNPSTNTIRHYKELTVTLTAVPNADNVAQVRNQPVTSEFRNVYNSQFLNYAAVQQARYTPLNEEGQMLVICYDDFMDEMEPFVRWKNEKGIRTVMVPSSTVGTSATQIKSYIQDYYENAANNLTYVLLVGDADQITSSVIDQGGWSGDVDSDMDYAYLAGNDAYPEVFIGRFSGETGQHITVQVEKSIAYEKYPATGAEAQWYKRAVGVASNEGPGDDDQYDYEHLRGIRDVLLDYTFNDVPELYQGSQGGEDASGSPTASMLADELNAGVSLFNYTGHGNVDMVVTSSFYNTNVNNLTNVGKWPFIWIVGCQTGNFVTNTCFAEAFARATTGAGHTGAVASMMATINQTWNPPMEGQDEMNAILSESYTNNIKRTFGGISFNGCMKMNDAYGNGGADMTDTWVLFGDPSIVVRTDVPAALTVTHPFTEPVGVSSIQITCNTNGALACLSNDGVIVATATVSGGIATFNFPAIADIDTLLLTVTAYNTVPYFGDINIVPSNGPYVVMESYTVNDAAGNNNGGADYSETITLGLTLKNVGNATASNVMATVASTNPLVTITDASETYGDIAADAMATLEAFTFTVNDVIPDGEAVTFNVTLTDGVATWQVPLVVTLQAPVLNATTHTVADGGGNGNGIAEPGETISIAIVTENNGNSNAPNGQAMLTTASNQVSIVNGTQNGDPIALGLGNTVTFNVNIEANATLYSFVAFSYSYDAGGYMATKSFNIKIGQASEDFETNDFSKFEWEQSGNAPWVTTDTSPFEGEYCSQSGDIGNNQNSSLVIEVSSLEDDTVRFARRVSSETGFDFLRFYVNDEVRGAWSGAQGWTMLAYAVNAGDNTLRWTYSKDGDIGSGADAAWVDDIVLPISVIATAIVSNDGVTSNDANIYPNPATASTTVWYAIGEAADVSVDVYNLLGQHVMVLQSEQRKEAGSYSLTLKTENLPAGQYHVMFRVNGQTFSRKLNVVK